MVTNTESCTNLVLKVLETYNKELTARTISKMVQYSETTVKKGICFLRKRGYKISTELRKVDVNGERVARIAYYRIELWQESSIYKRKSF